MGVNTSRNESLWMADDIGGLAQPDPEVIMGYVIHDDGDASRNGASPHQNPCRLGDGDHAVEVIAYDEGPGDHVLADHVHASGIWPAALRDETEALKMAPTQRLVMTARVRPFGEARIELTLKPDGDGTMVQMTETPTTGLGRWIHSPVTERLLVRRDVESLARLAALAEHRTEP